MRTRESQLMMDSAPSSARAPCATVARPLAGNAVFAAAFAPREASSLALVLPVPSAGVTFAFARAIGITALAPSGVVERSGESAKAAPVISVVDSSSETSIPLDLFMSLSVSLLPRATDHNSIPT